MISCYVEEFNQLLNVNCVKFYTKLRKRNDKSNKINLLGRVSIKMINFMDEMKALSTLLLIQDRKKKVVL